MQAAEIEPVSLAGVKLDLGDKRHLRTVAYAPRSQSYTLTKEQVARCIASNGQSVDTPPDRRPLLTEDELQQSLETQLKEGSRVHVRLCDLLLTDECMMSVWPDLSDSRIVSLTLSGNHIGKDGALALTGGLMHHPTLIGLHLGSNRIGDVGAAALGVLVAKNNKLRALGLGDNSIGDKGALHLAQGLHTNARLNTLQLGANKIGEQGCLHLARALDHNSSLVTLGLSGNPIVVDGPAHTQLLETMHRNTIIKNVVIDGRHIIVNQYPANALSGKPVTEQWHWADPLDSHLSPRAKGTPKRAGFTAVQEASFRLREPAGSERGAPSPLVLDGGTSWREPSVDSHSPRRAKAAPGGGVKALSFGGLKAVSCSGSGDTTPGSLTPRDSPRKAAPGGGVKALSFGGLKAMSFSGSGDTTPGSLTPRDSPRNCVLCAKAYEGEGFDPYPMLKTGRCCGGCDKRIVQVARVAAMQSSPSITASPRHRGGRRPPPSLAVPPS